MRSTQLQALRAVAAGADTVRLVANRLGLPLSSAKGRLRSLVELGFITQFTSMREHRFDLTDRARALLQRRDELDNG